MSWNLSLRYVVLWIVLGFFFLNFHLIPFPLLISTQDNQPSLLHTTTTESLHFLQIRKIAQSNEIGAARLFVILTGRFSHFITYFSFSSLQGSMGLWIDKVLPGKITSRCVTKRTVLLAIWKISHHRELEIDGDSFFWASCLRNMEHIFVLNPTIHETNFIIGPPIIFTV